MNSTANTSQVDELQILNELKNLKSNIKTGYFNLASAAARSIMTSIPGIKRHASLLINTLTGLVTSVSDGSISKPAARKEAEAALLPFEDYLLKALSELAAENPAAQMSKDLDFNSISLSKYESSRDEILKSLGKNLSFVGYSPVLPVAKPPLSQDALKLNGFQSELFHGYVILKSQLVAGLSSEYVRQLMDKSKGKVTADQVFDEFIASLKQKFSKLNLIKVGPTAQVGDGSLAWLIPSRQYDLLRRCTISGKSSTALNVSKWGFPFN